MALSSSSLSLLLSSVEIWFPCDNFSCGWPIVMKLWYDVCNHHRKVGIDFGGCGPYRLSKRGQKGKKLIFLKIIVECLFFMRFWWFFLHWIPHQILSTKCDNGFVEIWTVSKLWGSKRGNAQKINFFIFDPILKILFSLESSWKSLPGFFKQIFDYS